MISRLRPLTLGMTAMAALAATPAALHAQAADPAAARIAAYDDAVLGVMRAKLDLARRADRFETIVRTYYDMPAIAALVVGPSWATAPAPARVAAITALTRHSAVSLARNFAKFGGERFTVGTVTIRGANRIVPVTIASPGSADTLLYQLRQADGEWKIVDVIAGGVSQLAVQRADLAAIVRTGGVAGLAKKLADADARVAPR